MNIFDLGKCELDTLKTADVRKTKAYSELLRTRKTF